MSVSTDSRNRTLVVKSARVKQGRLKGRKSGRRYPVPSQAVMNHALSALSRAAVHQLPSSAGYGGEVVMSGGCRLPFSPVYYGVATARIPCFLRGFCGLPTSLRVPHIPLGGSYTCFEFLRGFTPPSGVVPKVGSQISNSASSRRRRRNPPSDCVPRYLVSAADLSKQGGNTAIVEGEKFAEHRHGFRPDLSPELCFAGITIKYMSGLARSRSMLMR